MKGKKYIGYIDQEGTHYGHRNQKSNRKLSSGVYTVEFDRSQGCFYFNEVETSYDQLVELPSPEYELLVSEVKMFLKPETKEVFKKFGYLYKRSALLHGKPGTGKTCIINRISEEVVKAGGIVLFNPNPEFLKGAFEMLDSTQSEDMIMVIFEEFDELIKEYEGSLLSLLDGEVQKKNVMYVATTNYFDKLPKRMIRPGRFSNVIEVGFPNEVARRAYLATKPVTQNDIDQISSVTDGFSIDELKEVVLGTKCLGYTLGDVTNRIRASRSSVKDNLLEDNIKDMKKVLQKDYELCEVPAEKEMIFTSTNKRR